MSTELDIALTHKYDPLITTRQQNIFTEEFFAGPDVSIYINGVEMISISQIQYSVQEQLKPIYGYDSMVFDDVAVGSRIVVGSFIMPIYNHRFNDTLDTLETLTPVKENLPSWILKEHSQSPETTTQFEVDLSLRTVQSKLRTIGYDVSETGVMDQQTYRSMTDFQRTHDISSVGEVNEELLKKLQVAVGELKPLVLEKDLRLHVRPIETALVCGTLEVGEGYIILNEQKDWCYICSTERGLKGYAPSQNMEGVR